MSCLLFYVLFSVTGIVAAVFPLREQRLSSSGSIVLPEMPEMTRFIRVKVLGGKQMFTSYRVCAFSKRPQQSKAKGVAGEIHGL